MDTSKDVIIDPELQSLVPALSDDERHTLEENLLRDGCLAPLVVWAEEGLLLDGHHRKELCDEHGIHYQVRQVSLPDRNAARRWIIEHQFGRRNLTPYQRAELVLKLKPLLAAEALAKKHTGRAAPPTEDHQNSDDPPTAGWTLHRLAKKVGLSHDTMARADYIDRHADEDTKERLRRGETTIHAEYVRLRRQEKECRRQERRAANARQVGQGRSLDDLLAAGEKFATVVLDPPWDWGDEGDGDQLGRARPVYATLPFERLLELPVDRLAEADSHLYLWITNRSLPKGFTLLDRWGFRYVTALTWCKPHFGMGNYFRGSTEHVLFGVRGSQPLKRKDAGTWFAAPRGPQGHSSKPLAFYELVESCSPGPYLELFARVRREGWVAWGAEVDAL